MAVQKFNVVKLSNDNFVPYLSNKIEQLANEAIDSRGIFRIGVSGGSIISFLAEGLPKIQTDFKCWRLFLCDERLVDEENVESTYGQYKRTLKVEGFLENFLPADVTLPAPQAAEDYENKLRALWEGEEDVSYGVADCLILGVGPDGHTCSLFPNHKVLDVKGAWVTSIEDSPKPPSTRITLTFPFINKATNILVVGKGKEKWDILEKVRNGEDFPIGRVDNPGGHLEWILNQV